MPEGPLEWGVSVVAATFTALVLVWAVFVRDDVSPAAEPAANAAPTSASVQPSEPVEPSEPAEPSSDIPQTPPAPDDSEALPVGGTFEGTRSATTLLQVRRIRPPDELEAEPDGEWLGLRAETCRNSDARPSGRLRLSAWKAEDGNGVLYAGAESPWEDFPAQQLPRTSIQPGDCSVGWVLVSVPPGTSRTIEKVIFRSAVWAP